jgi:hypothetical protein
MEASSVEDNEHSGFIKGGQFLEQLMDYWLLKENSALWS